MTVNEHMKVETPNEAMKQSGALGPVHFTVGFPSVNSAQRWGQTNHLRKHADTLAGRARVQNQSATKKVSMTIKALVMSDRSDEYTGKKGLVKQQIITVMDQSDGERLAQPIEYALSDEEKPVHAGKLQDKLITLGIRELLPFGGRLRARGKIVSLVGK